MVWAWPVQPQKIEERIPFPAALLVLMLSLLVVQVKSSYEWFEASYCILVSNGVFLTRL